MPKTGFVAKELLIIHSFVPETLLRCCVGIPHEWWDETESEEWYILVFSVMLLCCWLIDHNLADCTAQPVPWLSYGVEHRRNVVRLPICANSFSSLQRPDRLVPPQSPIQWVPWALSPAVKRPVRKADHSHSCSCDVKNTWIYMSTPHMLGGRSRRKLYFSFS